MRFTPSHIDSLVVCHNYKEDDDRMLRILSIALLLKQFSRQKLSILISHATEL